MMGDVVHIVMSEVKMNILQWQKQMLYVRNEMCKLDVKQIYHYYAPNNGCSLKEISKVEDCLGIKFDNQYKEFLQYVNGWKECYRLVSFLGTKELLSSEITDMAKEILEIECSFDEQLEFRKEELLPIAVDEYGSDLFVLTPPVNDKNGMVIWFAGGEIERFPSFEVFRDTILQYMNDELNEDFRSHDLSSDA